MKKKEKVTEITGIGIAVVKLASLSSSNGEEGDGDGAVDIAVQPQEKSGVVVRDRAKFYLPLWWPQKDPITEKPLLP